MADVVRKVAVIGLGRFGLALAKALRSAPQINLIAVDMRSDLVDKENQGGQWVLQSDGYSQDALSTAGIDKSVDLAIVAIGEDAEACQRWILALKAAGVDRIYARAQTDRMANIMGRLLHVGETENRVVRPEHSAARRIARTILLPTLSDVVDLRESSQSVATLALPARYAGKTLGDSSIRQEFGLTVLIILRAPDPETGRRQEVAPLNPTTELLLGDEVTVLGLAARIASFSA